MIKAWEISPQYWPHDDNQSLIEFYGYPGSVTLTHFTPPFKMIDAYEKHPISFFEIHPKCEIAFSFAFEDIWEHCDRSQDMIEKFHLHLFGGCYNPRKVRGSAVHWSVHAFAAAIDINPDGAPMGVNKRPSQSQMPDFAVTSFKKVGATWGGDFRGRKDWMHFQYVYEGTEPPEPATGV